MIKNNWINLFVLFYLIFGFSPLLISASSYDIEKVGMERGLSNNYILSIAEDNTGFLWFATEWGLNRFDGNSFTVFKNNPGNPNSIADNGINKILADKRNNKLWIATKRNGLNAFDCLTREFIRYPITTEEKNSTMAYGITDLSFDEKGNIWMATYGNGLKKLLVESDSIIHYDEAIEDHFIWSIVDDGNGNLYIGHANRGLSILSLKDKKLTQFTHDPDNPSSIPDNRVFKVYVDSRKNVWVGTNKGLALYHPERKEFTVFRHEKSNPHSLSDDNIQCITEIDDDMLWIGTAKGINILNLQHIVSVQSNKVRFRHIVSNDLPSGLSDGSVWDIFQDSFGNVWIGTNRAVNFIGRSKSFFNTIAYSAIKGDDNALSSKTASCIYYDNRKELLWVGAETEGVDVYRRNRKIAHYTEENSNLSGNHAVSVLVDSEGDTWVGTPAKGLLRLNRNTNRFEEFELPYENKGTRDIPILSLFEDNARNVWIGTYNGIFKYQLATSQIVRIDGADISLPSNLIRSLAQDADGNIWVGTMIDGVAIIDPQGELVKKMDQTANGINHISRDSHGNMWVCTIRGVYSFSYNGGYDGFSILNQESGIADDFVHAAVEGNEGEIWFSTNIGVSCYSLLNRSFENFSYLNGAPPGSFVGGCVTKSAHGTVFFGSQSGVCYFNSTKVEADYEVPPVQIIGFRLYEAKSIQPEHFAHIPVVPVVKLKYNQNTFAIDFNVMDYSMRDVVEYAYTLEEEGVDSFWHQTNGQNMVAFRNLSSGNYVFKVKARLKNQEWSTNISTLQLEIALPFWLSWWAKVLYALMIVSLGCFIVTYYLNKRDYAKEQELNNERLKFYTNIAHELKTPLTLIIGPLTDLMEEDTGIQSKHYQKIAFIHKSAIRLQALINQILEFRRSETHNRTLCVQKGDLAIYIKGIVAKYMELNQNDTLKIGAHIETEFTKIYYDPEVITIILDNLIFNAIKYTPQGSIDVFLREVCRKEKRYAEIEVRDTGYGISEKLQDRIFDRYFQANENYQATGNGIGLALVKNMVHLHEATIEVKSKPGEGASFFVRLDAGHTYPDAKHLPEEELAADEKQAGTSLPLLLVAEDHTDIRKYIVDSLAGYFEIIEAEDGKVALELAFDRIPDIIISDIMMPNMDGIHMCRILKEDMRTSHIPVIFLTAKDSVGDKIEGYSIGADSYITKPFNASLLQTRVNNLLEARKKMAHFFTTSTYKNIISTNALNELDNEFIEKTTSLIEDNISSEHVSASFLAEQLCMSYSSFSRKIKALTGMTSNELIRKIKMKRAEEMLLSRKYTVTEIAYQLGYSNMSHFRQYFKEEFGIVPSKFLKDISE